MKYLQCMGGVWKLSAASYKRLIRDIAADLDVNLDDYGKMVTINLENLEDLQRANRPKGAR